MNKKMGKFLKSIFYIVLGIGITLALHQPVDVMAADLEFQNNAISNISNNDARISAQIMNNSKMNVTETGFYLGTSSGILNKCSNNDSGNWKYSKISVGFTMSQYWGTLSENTTYYYCFYAIADGKEYISEEYSFKTTGGNSEKSGLSFFENNVTDVTENDGRINAKISNPDGRKVTETGFYIGTSSEIFKNTMNDPCSLTNHTITVGYTMSKYYGTLQPGTTYYYKFYAIGDGQEYCSEVYSFETNSISQPVPEPTSQPASEMVPEIIPEKSQPSASVTQEKAGLSFYENSVTDVTENNGRINTKISNPDGRQVTETGFYIGASPEVSKNRINDSCSFTSSTITIGYTMSEYYGALQPGTTYYYKFYAIGDGQEYCSEVYSFRTNDMPQSEPVPTPTPDRQQEQKAEISEKSGLEDSDTEENAETLSKESKISFSVEKVESISHENAKIRAEVKNPNKEKITETGFYYGTDKENMMKSIEADKGNWETAITVSYDIGKYARVCLMPETKYYYQFYVIVNDKEVVSEVNTFTTRKKKSESNTSVVEEIQDSNVSNNYEEGIKGNVVSEKETFDSNKQTYTIKLNASGGQVNPQSIKVVNGEYYGSLPIPVKEGYVFEGWYKNFVLWKEYVTETTIYKRGLGIIDTLYAKWREKNIYYVKFDANGGNVSESMRMVHEQDAIGNLPVPSREGYDFVGWFTESVGGKQISEGKIILGNEIYYAQWKECPKESSRFSQNDDKWTAKNSAFKKKYPGSLIKEQGCYLCSLAMSLNNMGFRDTTPIALYERNLDDNGNPDSYVHDGSIKSWYNSYMKQNGINKKLIHDKISISNNDYHSILKDVLLGTDNSGKNVKKYHLEQGAIVKLKRKGSEKYHYILATHIANDGTIRVNDPDNSNNNGGVWDADIQTVLKEERLKNYTVVGLELWYLK